ncbi:uncharacterized protein LOC120082160 isoform X1 [Benincasa hispida]|uniref:uncharacterized protein LOC120082160 isoform X1 n=1 Tax=Benincasa hispida TaxID=102211 RepID=UPI001901AFF1|nr:uncharacterized protein LOC120082160 isoform X1 [Benincasa hispida]XP_038893338.1 uncharacterized protein LOC120082160 isoform X1 [Benincasa hispida]XP_038893339.1 uncharacterized protein LOC120082160 isoform X1 [Benincasa hispida]XP_038893340.1 uncharacterized protein LOC120082160 isoform X1 [Benincasa hispida]
MVGASHSSGGIAARSDRTATIKFLCSYGGKILPRYPDGKLRYIGGETRVLAVDRSIPFSDDCIGSNSTLKTTRNYDCASAIVCTCEENLLLSEPEISETRLLCFLYQEFLSQSQVQYKYLSCSPQSCPSNCLLLLE